MTLPEDGRPEEVVGWLREQGWELTLHTDQPPRGDVSNIPRALRVLPRFTHWVDLVSLEEGGEVTRWYSGGVTEAEAVRSAGRRWRSEHGDSGS